MKVRIQIGSVLSIAIRVRLRVLRFWCGAGSSLLGFATARANSGSRAQPKLRKLAVVQSGSSRYSRGSSARRPSGKGNDGAEKME